VAVRHVKLPFQPVIAGSEMRNHVGVKRAVFAVLVLLAVGLGTDLATPASARWAYGDGSTNINVTNATGDAPEEQLCDNGPIVGFAGATGAGDPATFVVPPGPYGTRTVEVYVSDQSFLGSHGISGGIERSDGVPLKPLMTQTTAELTAINPLEGFPDLNGDPWTAYAKAPFSFTPPPGALHPGQYVAVHNAGAYAMSRFRVIACDPGGAQSTVGVTGLSNPRGVAVDGTGNVYVADTSHNRVLKLPAAGGAQQTLGFTGLALPYGVAVDAAGNVFVADTDNSRILKLPVGGGSQVVLPFTGLNKPYNVAVGGDGAIYVADTDNSRVVKLPTTGSQVVLPFTGMNVTGGVAVDADGNVYAADTGNNRILKLPITGTGQEVVVSTGLSLPFSIAVDARQDLFVADYSNNRVVKIANGRNLSFLQRAGQVTLAFSGLNMPLGVAVDKAGNVYAADAGNARIVKVPTALPQLRATTNPALPADIAVDGVARDAWGLTWPNFSPGSHQVCFGDVQGFATPACQSVTLAHGATGSAQGTYTQNGYLRVLTSPAVPSTVSVGGVPRNDWGMWAEVAPGTYNVCFGKVAGYTVPACRDVVVTAGATATTTGTFGQSSLGTGPTGTFGYLRVVTNPAVGAMITVDGDWRDNWGLTWVKVPTGSHQVCFGNVAGATAPACQTVTVTNGGTTVVTGTYALKGFLRVLTSPAVPGNVYVNGEVANAWGMWAPKATGTYTVCFEEVAGYETPVCQTSPAVTAGATATVTGTYTPTS